MERKHRVERWEKEKSHGKRVIVLCWSSGERWTIDQTLCNTNLDQSIISSDQTFGTIRNGRTSLRMFQREKIASRIERAEVSLTDAMQETVRANESFILLSCVTV